MTAMITRAANESRRRPLSRILLPCRSRCVFSTFPGRPSREVRAVRDAMSPPDIAITPSIATAHAMVGVAPMGMDMSELRKETGTTKTTIRNWVAQADRDAGVRSDGLTSDERKELNQLRRENRTLREEREILKKAAAWFAQEAGATPRRPSAS